jgi:hypothetical protein
MNATVILVGIVMVLALIGMIACAKKQRTNPNAQPLAIGLLIVVIACGVTIMIKTGAFGDGDTRTIIENETRFACAKAEKLGKYLASKFGGESVLVVANSDFNTNERTKRLISSLKDGLGSANVEVTTITVPQPAGMPEEEGFVMPVEEMMTAKDFDALLAQHKDRKLVVSMIGLPRDAQKMTIWKMSDAERPKIAIYNGDVHAMKGAIQQGYIVAVTSYKPGIKYSEDAPPSDVDKAFDMRYLLITPENVEKVANEHKGLFQ